MLPLSASVAPSLDPSAAVDPSLAPSIDPESVSGVLDSPPHAATASEAVNAKAAARDKRWGAAGTVESWIDGGSAFLQNGQLASFVLTWRKQDGQGASGSYIPQE
jgi:hypothetical protein